jgi:predicted nucleic acid-binding protein
MRVIVSDTSPIRYLVLIEQIEILQKLYGQILIPEAVRAELQQPHAPESVRGWIGSAPGWLITVSVPAAAALQIPDTLGEGERHAIALALDSGADLLLVDDRTAAREARRLGFTVTGTLGILVRAAEIDLLDLHSAVQRLETTNFRVHPKILRQLMK